MLVVKGKFPKSDLTACSWIIKKGTFANGSCYHTEIATVYKHISGKWVSRGLF